MPDVAIAWALTTHLSTTLPSWTKNPELVCCPLLDVFTGDWCLTGSLINLRTFQWNHCSWLTSASPVPYKITCYLWASSICGRAPLHIHLQTISKNLFSGGRTRLVWVFTGVPLGCDFPQRAISNSRFPLLYLPVIKDIQRKEPEVGCGDGRKRSKMVSSETFYSYSHFPSSCLHTGHDFKLSWLCLSIQK